MGSVECYSICSHWSTGCRTPRGAVRFSIGVVRISRRIVDVVAISTRETDPTNPPLLTSCTITRPCPARYLLRSSLSMCFYMHRKHKQKHDAHGYYFGEKKSFHTIILNENIFTLLRRLIVHQYCRVAHHYQIIIGPELSLIL